MYDKLFSIVLKTIRYTVGKHIVETYTETIIVYNVQRLNAYLHNVFITLYGIIWYNSLVFF